MISIWKNLHRFEGKSHPFTWQKHSIVRNAALTELKRENRHAEKVVMLIRYLMSRLAL